MQVDAETAKLEIQNWIKALNLNPVKVKKLKDEIETAEALVEEGLLMIDGKKATLTLFEPVGDDKEYTELHFTSNKLTVKEVTDYSGKGDNISKTYSLLSKMIDQENRIPLGFLMQMAEDFGNIQAVMSFFLPR